MTLSNLAQGYHVLQWLLVPSGVLFMPLRIVILVQLSDKDVIVLNKAYIVN